MSTAVANNHDRSALLSGAEQDSRSKAAANRIVYSQLHSFRCRQLQDGVNTLSLTDTQWGLVPLSQCHHITAAAPSDSKSVFRVCVCQSCSKVPHDIDLGSYLDQESAILVNDVHEILARRFDRLLVLREEDLPHLSWLRARQLGLDRTADTRSVMDILSARVAPNSPNASAALNITTDASRKRKSPQQELSTSKHVRTEMDFASGPHAFGKGLTDDMTASPTPNFRRQRSYTFNTSADFAPRGFFAVDALSWLAAIATEEAEMATSLSSLSRSKSLLNVADTEANSSSSTQSQDKSKPTATTSDDVSRSDDSEAGSTAEDDGDDPDEGLQSSANLLLLAAHMSPKKLMTRDDSFLSYADPYQSHAVSYFGSDTGDRLSLLTSISESLPVNSPLRPALNRSLSRSRLLGLANDVESMGSMGDGAFHPLAAHVSEELMMMGARRGRSNSMSVIEGSSLGTFANISRAKDPLSIALRKYIERGGIAGEGFIGIYGPEDRKARIARFVEKRKHRMWTKKVKYDVRKNFADSRIRIKGRFVKKDEEQAVLSLTHGSVSRSNSITEGDLVDESMRGRAMSADLDDDDEDDEDAEDDEDVDDVVSRSAAGGSSRSQSEKVGRSGAASNSSTSSSVKSRKSGSAISTPGPQSVAETGANGSAKKTKVSASPAAAHSPVTGSAQKRKKSADHALTPPVSGQTSTHGSSKKSSNGSSKKNL